MARVSEFVNRVLDALEITVSTVPTLNLYLFELVQNALDVGASQMRFVLEETKVSFEHNGATFGHTDHHVRGLANVFQSTKSVGSIGFMGFGFKTLYKRFLRVSVCDVDGWSFGFNVKEEEIKLSADISVFARHWLGAMAPEWQDGLSSPAQSEGFSTRFELVGVTSDTKNHPLSEDFREAFLAEHGTSLAILATKGLKRLEFHDKISHQSQEWTFTVGENSVVSVSETSARASALALGAFSENTLSEKRSIPLEWLLLRHEYVPSDMAVKSLCQARLKNILAQSGREGVGKVWASLKRPYTIFGLVPLNEQRLLESPKNGGGTIFATLPLNAMVPFGIHVQADWLLDLARQGLRDVKTNAWQKSIVESLAGLLAKYIAAIPTLPSTRDSISNAFKLINMSARNASDIDVTAPEWIALLRKEIESVAFLPVHGHGSELLFMTLAEVCVLPKSKEATPVDANLLFGRFILNRDLVDDEFVNFMVSVKLLEPLDVKALLADWQSNGLSRWWRLASAEKSSEEEHRLLLALWTFLSSVFPRDVCSKLPSVICADPLRPWIPPTEVTVLYNKEDFKLHDSPSEITEGLPGAVADRILAPFLPRNRFPSGWVSAIVKSSGVFGTKYRTAYEWIESFWKKEDVKKIVQRAFTESKIAADDATLFAVWALNRSSPSLVTHVAVDSNEVVPVESAVLASPYTADETEGVTRREIFAQSPAISAAYSSPAILRQIASPDFSDETSSNKAWRDVFANLKALGPVVLAPKVYATRSVFPDYTVVKKEIADQLGISDEAMKDVNTTMREAWKLWDVTFQAPLSAQSASYLRTWLEGSIVAVEEARGAKYVEGYNRRSFYAYGRDGSATWIQDLQSLPWLYVAGEWRAPSEVTYAQAEKVISARLAQALVKKGIRFKH